MGTLAFISVYIFVTIFCITCSAYSKYPMQSSTRVTQPGEPLFLTPYIENGNIEEAQQAALVEPFLDNIISYSGFLTLNKEYNSNMYFWFFPAEINSAEAPLLLWLQGGPGVSGVYTVFDQLGPYYIDQNNQLKKREIYWSRIYNIIYVDNPIGTGFSFTENDNGYSTNQKQIGENLYNAMKQFYQLFPKFKKNDFYIVGASYGGKFSVALGYVINEIEKKFCENEKMNLKGLIIGSGFIDPITVIERSDILYQIGLIDINVKLELESYINQIKSLISQEKYLEALEKNTVMRNIIFENLGFENLFNFLHDKFYYPFGDNDKFITSPTTRFKLHVGNISFNSSEKIFPALGNEIMQSLKPWFEILVNKYRILMFNGQLDLEITYKSIITLIRSLNWNGSEIYNKAKREKWYVDNELAGYMKTAGNLTEVLVRNAGHMAALDQPKFMIELMKYFLNTS